MCIKFIEIDCEKRIFVLSKRVSAKTTNNNMNQLIKKSDYNVHDVIHLL